MTRKNIRIEDNTVSGGAIIGEQTIVPPWLVLGLLSLFVLFAVIVVWLITRPSPPTPESQIDFAYEIVVDTSDAMNALLENGKTRYEVALEAVDQIASLPRFNDLKSTWRALRIAGGNGCDDTRSERLGSALSADEFIAPLRALRAGGLTNSYKASLHGVYDDIANSVEARASDTKVIFLLFGSFEPDPECANQEELYNALDILQLSDVSATICTFGLGADLSGYTRFSQESSSAGVGCFFNAETSDQISVIAGRVIDRQIRMAIATNQGITVTEALPNPTTIPTIFFEATATRIAASATPTPTPTATDVSEQRVDRPAAVVTDKPAETAVNPPGPLAAQASNTTSSSAIVPTNTATPRPSPASVATTSILTITPSPTPIASFTPTRTVAPPSLTPTFTPPPSNTPMPPSSQTPAPPAIPTNTPKPPTRTPTPTPTAANPHWDAMTRFEPPRPGIVFTVTGAKANVRSDATDNGLIIGQLDFGAEVLVYGELGGWYFIGSGWVANWLIKLGANPVEATQARETVSVYTPIPPTDTPTNTPIPTEIPTNTPASGRDGGSGGGSGGSGSPSITIQVVWVGTYVVDQGCQAGIRVTVTGPNPATGNIHVWNNWYGEQGQPEGDVYPTQTFPVGTSDHTIGLGGHPAVYKLHDVWVTSDIGNSNRISPLVCQGWP